MIDQERDLREDGRLVGTTRTAPSHLRAEHLGGAVLGIGTGAPRLSWRLPSGATQQVRYRIAAGGEVHGWVESDRCVLVGWPGEPVGSRSRVAWKVQVVTEAGESDWSLPAWFETPLLDPDDWTAQWIEPVDDSPRGEFGHPAHVLMTTFVLDAAPGRARLYATARGIYEVFLNGRRVGDQELTPGFTSYWDHIDVQTYDVTDLLAPGANEWTVVLSDGWYRGKVGNGKEPDNYGDTVAFLGQLHADDLVVATGPEWSSRTETILAADLMDGQIEDRTAAPGTWRPVGVIEGDAAQLSVSPAPPTRRVEELRPTGVRRLDERRQIVDLGQNIHGWIRLHDLGPAGSTVSLVHGEALDGHGDVTLDNVCFGDLLLRQTDRVVSSGRDGDVFEPRHTSHGFQYVRVEGHPHRLTPDDVTGVVVHTDLRATGWFRCSDERVNRFHDITRWSLRSNACEIPTDCPQRERSGWTGDWQLFFPAAAFMYDVAGFSLKWLRSLAADQLPNGCLANMAPEPRRARRAIDDPTWIGLLGSSGWGDAIVVVPWELYSVYDDEQVLADFYPAMTRWVDYAAGVAADRRHHRRAAERPEAAPHETFLWDAGWHFGEWLEPGEPDVPFWDDDHGHVGTAYLHRSATQLAQIAGMLGHDRDAEKYGDLGARTLDAWRTEYLCEDGTLVRDTQATYARALAFNLVPDELRARAAGRLVELIREADDHLSTGFLATPLLLPALADAGYSDVAHDLLFQDTPPSWLTMVNRGASTVWESWDGIDADGVAHESLNHYSKGAVISFLHTHVAGIRRLDDHPGYRRFRIAPVIDDRLDWAEAVHDCPYGRIESSWSRRGGHIELVVTVPPGTTAEIRDPSGALSECAPGTHSFKWSSS